MSGVDALIILRPMTSLPGRARLATVTIPAPDLRPETFLRHAEGEERGFWA
jgi:hypothetical protein